jgi:hypothetical protein
MYLYLFNEWNIYIYSSCQLYTTSYGPQFQLAVFFFGKKKIHNLINDKIK